MHSAFPSCGAASKLRRNGKSLEKPESKQKPVAKWLVATGEGKLRRRPEKVRSTTYARLGGILDTRKARLPVLARQIDKRTVAEYIEVRSGVDEMKPGTVVKEVSVLKHCLKLAVEWGELNQNPAAGARLPQLPPGKTRYLTPGELKAAPRGDLEQSRKLRWIVAHNVGIVLPIVQPQWDCEIVRSNGKLRFDQRIVHQDAGLKERR